MSTFDPPNIKGAISPFRSAVAVTFAEYSAEIVGMWLIENLKSIYPTHNTLGGPVTLHYGWFFDLTPKTMQNLSLPAISIDVVVAEYATIGTAIGDGEGGVAAGALKKAEIAVVIIANSARLAASIEGKLGSVIDRLINFAEEIPMLFVEKYHFADDRGFSTIDRFVMTSLWQNLPDEAFVKLTFYQSGFVEDYINDDDEIWAGIVGSINTDMISDGDTTEIRPPSHVSLSFKFTPTIV